MEVVGQDGPHFEPHRTFCCTTTRTSQCRIRTQLDLAPVVTGTALAYLSRQTPHIPLTSTAGKMSTTTTTTSTHTILKAEQDSTASPSTTAALATKPSNKEPESSKPNQNQDTEQKQPEEEPDIYDEIEIEDMTYDSTLQIYHYPCPCGDRFEIAIASLRDGDDIAVCPGCSLTIRVIFDEGDLEKEDG